MKGLKLIGQELAALRFGVERIAAGLEQRNRLLTDSLSLQAETAEVHKADAERLARQSDALIAALEADAQRGLQEAQDAAWAAGVTPEQLILEPAEARKLVLSSKSVTARKRARVLAIRMWGPFRVQTAQGIIAGAYGDWLVTNHPDDDPGSDTWPVSAERFSATYESVDEPDEEPTP